MVLRKTVYRDSILAFAAVTVIALSLFADRPDQQLVLVRGESKGLDLYALETTDPRVKEIRDRIGQWRGDWPNAKLATLRWRKEMASLYADRLPDEESVVVQASFQPTSAPLITPANREYWVTIERQADELIDRQQQIQQWRKEHAVHAPVRLGGPIASGDRLSSIASSILLGLLAACLIAGWNRLSPKRTLSGLTHEVIESETQPVEEASREIAVEIPAHWVRMHQTLSVRARQSVLGCLAISAMMLSISAWI